MILTVFVVLMGATQPAQARQRQGVPSASDLTEDYPLEASFDAVIPPGQYGAGT